MSDVRANKGHWTEYIKFLRENPCMVKDQAQNNELWTNLANRLNKVNACKKPLEKWKESIKNWRKYALSKYDDKKALNDCEIKFIDLIKASERKQQAANINVIHKQGVPKEKTDKNNNKPCAVQKPRKGEETPKLKQNENLVKHVRDKTPEEPTKQHQIIKVQPLIGPVFKTNKEQLLRPLKIYYQNVRGLRTKLEKFSRAVLQENYDVIVLTETWLIPAIPSQRVFDDRYFVYRTDRSVLNSDKSIGGGVLIAVLKSHGSVKRHPTNGVVEEVWITLVKYNLVMGAVYLPPRTPESKFKQFLTSANILNTHKKGIIIGDFNMRRITWLKEDLKNVYLPTDVTVDSFKTLLGGLKLLGVEQRNDILNTNGVILDLVYSNTNLVSITKTDSPFVRPDYHHPPLNILLPLHKNKPSGG